MPGNETTDILQLFACCFTFSAIWDSLEPLRRVSLPWIVDGFCRETYDFLRKVCRLYRSSVSSSEQFVMQICMNTAINYTGLRGIYKPPHSWIIVWTTVQTINIDVATDIRSQDGQTCLFNLLDTNRAAIMSTATILWWSRLLEGKFTFLEKNQTLTPHLPWSSNIYEDSCRLVGTWAVCFTSMTR
jgi:hypothetical protein